MKTYGIWGVGGFAREVMPMAIAMLGDELDVTSSLVFVIDGVPAQEHLNGREVWSSERFLSAGGERYFNVAIAASDARRRISDMCLSAGVQAFGIRAPNCWVAGTNQIGEGAILCPFTTVTGDARIGKFFQANIYSYVAHDCEIGDYVTFAPGVHCNGRVKVEDDVYIGTGAVLREGRPDKPIVIGEGAVVGMGAVVTRSVAPHTTVVGNPAAILKK